MVGLVQHGDLDRVQAGERAQDQLRARSAGLSTEIDRLRTSALGDDDQAVVLRAQIERLGPVVGTVAVTGPGMVIEVDDAPAGSTDARDRVLDVDLQMLANGLWQAGAEAIAVNGQRLTATSTIRAAGGVILVDFKPVTSPYEVSAIGPPDLADAFSSSATAKRFRRYVDNYRMQFGVKARRGLTLAAAPEPPLRYAHPPSPSPSVSPSPSGGRR